MFRRLLVSHQSVIGASMILSIGNLLTMALGYVFTLVIVWNFGATGSSDAYYLSMTACAFLTGILEGCLMGSMVPAFATQQFQSLVAAERNRQWSSLLNLLLVITLFLAAVMLLWADTVIAFLGPTLDVTTRTTTARLTRLLVPTILLLPIASFFAASLNSLNKFASRVIANAISGLCSTGIAVGLVGHLGVYALGWAVSVGALVRVLVMGLAIHYSGFRYYPSARFRLRSSNAIGGLFVPILLLSILLTVRETAVKSLATMAGSGALTAFSLGIQLADLPLGIVVSTFGSAVLPTLSKLWSEHAKREFMNAVMAVLRTGLFLTIPAAIGIIILGGPIIQAVFQRGAFDSRAVHLTMLVVMCYAIGLPFRGANDALGSALYATRDAWRQVLFSGSGVVIALGTGILLLPYFAGPGLAASLSLGNAVNCFFHLRFLHRRLDVRPDMQGVWFVLKAIGAALAMAAIVLLAYKLLVTVAGEVSGLRGVLALGILACMGAGVYLAMGRLVSLRESVVIRNAVLARLAKKGEQGV